MEPIWREEPKVRIESIKKHFCLEELWILEVELWTIRWRTGGGELSTPRCTIRRSAKTIGQPANPLCNAKSNQIINQEPIIPQIITLTP